MSKPKRMCLATPSFWHSVWSNRTSAAMETGGICAAQHHQPQAATESLKCGYVTAGQNVSLCFTVTHVHANSDVRPVCWTVQCLMLGLWASFLPPPPRCQHMLWAVTSNRYPRHGWDLGVSPHRLSPEWLQREQGQPPSPPLLLQSLLSSAARRILPSCTSVSLL